jgi:hypothetical protein
MMQTGLVRFLRFVASQSGETKPGGGVLLNLGLPTKQFASLLCTTRQTLSTMLNILERERRVELRKRGSIFIPSLGLLG